MKLKMWITAAVLALFLLGALPAEAQTRKRAGKSGESLITLLGGKTGNAEDIEGTGVKSAIILSAKTTPVFVMGAHDEQKQMSKNERKNSKPWIEIIIPFKTKLDQTGANRWLENVEATVEIMTPMLSDRQKPQVEWGILRGTATLAPVANVPKEKNKILSGNILAEKDGYAYHVIRFYVAPSVVARYLLLPSLEMKTLAEMIPGLPVRVKFLYDKEEYIGIGVMSKNYIKTTSKTDAFKKMLKSAPKEDNVKDVQELFLKFDDSPRTFFTVENAIIPASKTPWAWFDYDRQEHTVDDMQRSK